jgi:hypothetical protein
LRQQRLQLLQLQDARLLQHEAVVEHAGEQVRCRVGFRRRQHLDEAEGSLSSDARNLDLSLQ